MSVALNRLIIERIDFRKNPMYGFAAKPRQFSDGSLNLFYWDCVIPGRENTPWAGGKYCLCLIFPPNYPDQPPMCVFTPPLLHPNINPNGHLSLPMLKKGSGWEPSITIKEILIKIESLIHNPNMRAPANMEASKLYRNSRWLYMSRVYEQAKKMSETS